MGKGSQTTTTNSVSSPDPQAYQAYSQLLQRAQGVASTPYQAYTGQLTAPVNAQQQMGINNINANANFAQPYVQQAAGLASGAANPLTAQQIANYQNPYTQSVVDATQAQFNNQNAQAQQGLTGNAIAQGALGGNRVGVAQANLSGQQQLSQAPVIAGLYNQSYTQALQAAQQQYQQNPLAAANSIANFGISGQGAALSGAGAQLGAGTLQQQTDQQNLNALYQQYQQAQAYPYQQAQWLAGLTTGVGSNLGGTSSGTSTGPAPNQTAQYLGLGLAGAGLFLNRGGGVKGYAGGGGVVPRQHLADGGVSGTPWSGGLGWIPQLQIHGGSGAPHASAPSPSQQPAFDATKFANGLAGLGKAGLGDKIGSWFNPEAYGAADGGVGSAYGGSSSNPLPGLSAADYGEGFARGGGVAGYADGGSVSDDPDIMERLARWSSEGRDQGQRKFYNETRAGLLNSSTAPEHGSTYGGIGLGLADRRALQMHEAQDISDRVRGRRGYADGGAPDFLDRFAPAVEEPLGPMTRAQGLGLVNATRAPTVSGVAASPPPPSDSEAPIYDDGQGPVRLYGQRPEGNPTALKGTPLAPAAPAASDDEEVPPEAVPTAGRGVVGSSAGQFTPPYQIGPEDVAPPRKDPENSFGLGWLSPNAKSGLLTAGLSMLASRSPFLGNAVGEGGLAGLSAYGSAEEKDRKAAEDAQKLSLEAKKAANELARQTFQTNESARHNIATEHQAAVNADRTKFIPIGSTVSPDGTPHPLVMDQSTGKIIDATTGKLPSQDSKFVGKNDKGPPVSDEDAKAVAMRYVKTGDRTQLQGLGVSGAARQKVNHYIGEVQKELGISDEELGTRVAEWEGRKAGQRTLGTQEAKMGSAAMEAEGAIGQARGVIERLPRTSFLPLNKLIQGYQTNNLNPDQAELYGRTQAIVNTYSAVMARGANITTDSARGHAEALLNTASNPETYNRMLDTMLQEIAMAKNSPSRMREFYRKEYGPQAAPPEPGTAAAPTAAKFTPPQGAIARQYNGKTYYYDPATKQPFPGQQ